MLQFTLKVSYYMKHLKEYDKYSTTFWVKKKGLDLWEVLRQGKHSENSCWDYEDFLYSYQSIYVK